MKTVVTEEALVCFHCGNECDSQPVVSDQKNFCCEGCKLVYEILNENGLCNYYNLNTHPGNTQVSGEIGNRFSYLDNELLVQQLISFTDGNTTHVSFQIPEMHCSSCIWLLENLNRINNGVVSSRVDFLKKQLFIIYNEETTTLRKIVEQLVVIGYEPEIHLASIEKKKVKSQNRLRLYRIGVAGFCLGNIMLLSFPEYFSGGQFDDAWMRLMFGYVNLVLALPVVFFSAWEFFGSALKSFKQKTINIDVAISLGIAAMFIRSSYEILSHSGAGYFDSMTGMVFFTLCGRWFQEKTFDSLSFERDFKSYFPIAVEVVIKGIEKMLPVYEIKQNDIIRVRNNEIIPVDGLLLSNEAAIDYSFVTGESHAVQKQKGDLIFAGGRQTGMAIDICVTKELNQSYLTQLWNNNGEHKAQTKFEKLLNDFSRWFILATLLLAISAFAYWFRTDLDKAVNAFTAVLIIACPCAFTLSAPFTFGNMLRLLGKHKIYLKGLNSIFKLADVDTVVFDKTGTITVSDHEQIIYHGKPLTDYEFQCIRMLTAQSSHPLSKQITSWLKLQTKIPKEPFSLTEYSEQTGLGIAGKVNDSRIKLGSASFTGVDAATNENTTRVYLVINEINCGYFEIKNSYRKGFEKLIEDFKSNNYQLALLSGDSDSEKEYLQKIFGQDAELLFKQTPADKLNYIKALQQKNKTVLMIGDGLNDAGALQQSDAGLSIADDTNNFTPACDGIVDAKNFSTLKNLLSYSRNGINIVKLSFVLSLFYNAIGLYYAMTGTLQPVIAAILMPVSTVSLVLIAVGLSSMTFRLKNAPRN